MQTLGSGGEQKPNWLEKIIRLAIPAGLIFGGMKLFNAFAPTLIEFFNNFWHVALVGVPAVFLTLFILKNPTFLWMGYTTLCRKITSFFIKMDPLSFMDRYVDLLKEKRKGLQKNKTELNANKIQLGRDIDALKKNIDENMRKSKAAMSLGDKDQAALHGSLAATDRGSYNLYIPIYKKMETNLLFLEKLDENWGRSIEKLSHTVEAKRKEFATLKTMAKALGAAAEFASGDTEANRIYKESVIALEENVSKKLAFIEDFENSSKGAMKSIDLDKQMMNEEGLELLAEYEANGTVFLSEDYSSYEMSITPGTDLFSKANSKSTTINTPTSGGGKGEFGNFLKK
jgi:hypothetical protein